MYFYSAQKKRHFNRLCGDTQRRDFRPLEDKNALFSKTLESRRELCRRFFKKGIFSQFRRSNRVMKFMLYQMHIQGVFESCAEILSTSYWLHVELGKNI
jgi:hypothetical protein